MAAVDKFVFVNYTGQPDVEARQSLPTVRQHVMHDFFRRQREAENGSEGDAAVVSAATTRTDPRRRNPRQATQPRSKRKNIRRPPRAHSNHQTTDPVRKRDASHSEVSSCSEEAPSLSDCTSVGFPDFSSPFSAVQQQSSCLSPEFEAVSPRSVVRASSILYSPAVHRWDPFNSMPLNGESVDHLATWHFHRPINRNNIWESKVTWLDKVDSHFRRGLWSIALTSTPLFHILLCIAEMKRSVLTGDRNQVKYYEHKIAAMRSISEGVSKMTGLPQITDSSHMPADEAIGLSDSSRDTFVMLVAIQVNLALGDKEYDAAKTHMKCVLDLANKAGGLQTFGYTQWRHTLWNDLKLASACLERPMLPYQPRFEQMMFPEMIVTEAHRLSLETVRLIPTSANLDTQTAYDLMNRLHQLNLGFDAQLTEESHFFAVENNFYKTVYQLCTMVADSQGSRECTATDMLTLGSQLTVWMCMPSLVNMRALFNTVINTIQSKLVYRIWNGMTEKTDLIAFWEQEAKLESLLWVLFQACTATQSVCQTGETWMPQYMLPSFLNLTRQVAMRLNITSFFEFEKTMRLFPFSDNVFGDDSKALWRSMGFDSEAVSPNAMIIEES